MHDGARQLRQLCTDAESLAAQTLSAVHCLIASISFSSKNNWCVGGNGGFQLALALSPAYIWFAAISALPHKEERFLYVVYPLVRFARWLASSVLPD